MAELITMLNGLTWPGALVLVVLIFCVFWLLGR